VHTPVHARLPRGTEIDYCDCDIHRVDRSSWTVAFAFASIVFSSVAASTIPSSASESKEAYACALSFRFECRTAVHEALEGLRDLDLIELLKQSAVGVSALPRCRA
jgi:hypothetical protein